MKNSSEIIMKLENLICECAIDLSVTQEDINDCTDLTVDFGYDSISIITLIVRIEEEFMINFDDDVLMLDYIRNYKWLKEYLIGKVLDYDE